MAGPNGHFKSGKGGRETVNGVNLTLQEWSYSRKGDDVDTTNFESGGADQGLVGVLSTDLSSKGLFDAQQNPLGADPPGLVPRDDLMNTKFFTNVTDNMFLYVPQSRVLSAENSCVVRQGVTFSWSGKSNGSGVLVPTGTV